MPSGMGYGAGVGLQEVLSRLFLQTQQNQARERERQTLERQARIDAENTRFRDADLRLRQETHDRLTAHDKAKADADAAAQADRARVFGEIISNPTLPAATRNLLMLNQHNLGSNLNVHSLESADEHAAHEAATAKATDEREFADWKRRQDYTEQQRRSRPQITGRLVKNDPAFPAGVQSHVAQIRSRHPDFDAALGELVNSFEAHRQAHPNFQPQKAIDALRVMYSGGGAAPRRTPVNPNIANAVAEATGGGRPVPTHTPAVPAASSGPSAKGGGGGVVTGAQLAEIAARHGMTLEQARAQAQARGYQVQ